MCQVLYISLKYFSGTKQGQQEREGGVFSFSLHHPSILGLPRGHQPRQGRGTADSCLRSAARTLPRGPPVPSPTTVTQMKRGPEGLAPTCRADDHMEMPFLNVLF